MARKNNYLVIDFGNSCIKAGIYSNFQNKLIETQTVGNKLSAADLLKTFSCLNEKFKIDFVVASVTARKTITDTFFADLKKILNVDIKLVCQEDFDKVLDLSNIAKDVKIGTDILVCAYYGTKIMQRGFVVSLGTIYYGVFFENKQITNVLFVPSLVKGLDSVAQYGMIDQNSIPRIFDKTTGLNTKDCFAAGANILMEGAIDSVVRAYGLTADNVLIMGGDGSKYKNTVKKYKYDNMLIIKGLILLIKEKSW